MNATPTIVAAIAPAATISFAGATEAAAAITKWTVGFTSSATNGALIGGSTITAVFDASFAITAVPTITLGAGFTNCTAAGATTAGSTVTITLADSAGAGSCSLAANTATTVVISGVTNPAVGTYTNTNFTVKTLSDSVTASPAANIAVAAQTTPTAVSVTASNRAAAASGVTYTTTFTPSAVVAGPPPTTGALAAGDTITVVLPASTTVPASPTITPTAGFGTCAVASPGETTPS